MKNNNITHKKITKKIAKPNLTIFIGSLVGMFNLLDMVLYRDMLLIINYFSVFKPFGQFFPGLTFRT